MNFICQLQLQNGINVLNRIYKQMGNSIPNAPSRLRRSEKNDQVAKKQKLSTKNRIRKQKKQ